jgi:hypothetical protein
LAFAFSKRLCDNVDQPCDVPWCSFVSAVNVLLLLLLRLLLPILNDKSTTVRVARVIRARWVKRNASALHARSTRTCWVMRDSSPFSSCSAIVSFVSFVSFVSCNN